MQRDRKRDLSLQTIYRKDYHSSLPDEMNKVRLPKGTKNESTNIRGKSRGYLDLNSTYLANYHASNPERQSPILKKGSLPQENDLP